MYNYGRGFAPLFLWEEDDMIYDLQRAGIGKRISAFLFDFIMFITLAVGVAFLVSTALDYDGSADRVREIRVAYGEEYGVDLDITSDEYSKLTESEKDHYKAAEEAFAKDTEVKSLYDEMLNFILIIISISPLLSMIILEFIVPLLLKNGQTIGKKIFGVGVVLQGGIRITALSLFTRSLLGKFAIETAIPIIAFLMMLFTPNGIVGALIMLAIIAVNAGLLLMSKNHTVIHDIVSYSVCVDISSQLIFNSEEELVEYKNRIHAEANDLGGADY